MRRLLTLLVLLLWAGVAHAQYTVVNATVLDPTGSPYVNGSFTAQFYDPGTSGKLPLLNGSTFQTVVSGQLDSFGHFSIVVADNVAIATSSGATNTTWIFNVCSQAYTNLGNQKFCFGWTAPLPGITGTSVNISSQLQAVAAILPSTSGGGNVTPSPQFTFGIFPGPGVIASIRGGNITTDSTFNNLIVPGTITLSGRPVASISGTVVPGDCTNWLTATTIGDAGLPCGSGGGGSGTVTPNPQYQMGAFTIAGTHNTIGGSNITTDSTFNNLYIPGTLSLTGNVITPLNLADNGAAGNAAVKSYSGDGICYASTNGSDSNDGLSWGTAKLTIRGCAIALPGGSTSPDTMGSGTVYFTDQTSAHPTSGCGFWVMGSTDPNYASPPTCWIRNPGSSTGLTLIGIAKGNYGIGPTMSKARLNGGNAADINHPCIWISGVNTQMVFENIQCNFEGRPILVGEDSNHSRAGVNDGGSTGISFINVGASPNAVAGQGPAWDIVGGSFWINFSYCFGEGNSANTATANNTASFLFDGTGNDGIGEVYLDHISVTTGGIKVIPGTVNPSVQMFEADHVEGESLVTPALIWFTGQMGAAGVHDVVANDSIGTLCNGGVCAIENDGTAPDNLSVSGALLGSSLPPTKGPMIEVGGFFDLVGQPGISSSFLLQGLRGVIGSQLVGNTDASRRQFGPTSPRFANTALSPASYIVIPGTTLTQNVADPSGGTNATRLTATGPGEGVYVASQSGITVNVGDWFVFGAWVHSYTLNGYATSGNPLSIGISGCAISYDNYPGFFPTPSPPYGGDGQWQWISTGVEVATVSGTCQPNITVSADATHTLDLFSPVYFHIAAASAPSANEMLEVANNLQAYSNTCAVGQFCTASGPFTASLPSGTQGNPLINGNGVTTYATSPQSIDVTSYGVTSSGDQTANFQAAANAIPSTGGVLKVPAGLTILLSAPITFPHTPVTVDCSGGPDYGAATTFFEAATATYLFRVGTINNGSAQQQGVQFKGCGFADSSASHNTALGAIYVTDTNNSGAVDSSFFNFNRPAITRPSAPSISAGSGSTSYWVQISCATDMGGHTIYSPEATAVSGTTTLTVTAPTSSGCPAPSSGYLVLASTTATGTETLQAASGCTLNSSGTACSLTSNWVGTVTAGNLPEAFFQYDTSAGAPIIVDGQSGANGTPQDASYGHWDNNTFQNSQECMIFDGGIQGSVNNNHLSQCVVYGILTNRQNAQIYSYGNSFEIPNNTTARGLILNGTASSHVEAKFEGTGSGNTNITCSEVNTSRNFIGGNWTKCGVRLVQENAGVVGNTYDIHQQVSNNASPLINTGHAASDIIFGDTLNGGAGTSLPQITITGLLTTLASATGGAGLNLPQGTAPTSPNNGDVWITSTGVYARVNSATVGPFGTGSGGANTALSNLASVAVNAALSPGTDNSISLDDLNHRYINNWLSGVLGWTNGSGTADTGLSRDSAGVVDVGNGTAGDASGTLQTAVVQTVAGANPGMITLPGQTGTPIIGSNLFGWLGPNSASFTSYVLQASSTAPSGTQAFECGTPVSGISACSWATLSSAWSSVSHGANADSGAWSTTGPWTFSAAGAASTPGMSITGAPYTGGTGTTTLPQFYINSGTAPSGWNTAGTTFGVNAPSGFSGNLIDLHVNGATSVFSVGSTGTATLAGSLNATVHVAAASFYTEPSVHLLFSATAPTISSGFGSTPSIAANNGTLAFTVNVGTGGSATSGVIGLPTATAGWICFATDQTTPGTNATKQTANSTTTATLSNYNTTTGSAAAWTASDTLYVSCTAY